MKEVLTGTPLLRVEKKINTNNNIHYSPTLPPQFPSTPVTNKYTSAAANTVYDRTQKSIESLKEKYRTKPTEYTVHKTVYNNYSTTASPASVPYTYKHLANNYLMAQYIFHHHVNHIYYEAVKHQTVDTLINGEQKYLCTQSMSNELCILSQGKDEGFKVNNCVDFIHHRDVPNYIKVTYENFV